MSNMHCDGTDKKMIKLTNDHDLTKNNRAFKKKK